ncbi:MAG: hypothetical protein R2912_09075 [Eubacteriales bacterium]
MLHRGAIKRDTSAFVPLGVLAGALPLIHTHSFLALGIVSGSDLIRSFIKNEGKKQWLGYAKYLGIVLLLALPQLIFFTFKQSGGFLKFHFNWANESDNYIWFYIKNFGLIALLSPVAFLAANKEEKGIVGGAILIWLIAEFIQFALNLYDNNKLLFIAFVYACGLVGSWLFDAKDRLTRELHEIASASRFTQQSSAQRCFCPAGSHSVASTVSEYQLIDADQVAAAEYVKENAAPDATFLTYNNHNNCIAALTGRNIVCGSGSYLFFHGVDYSAREQALPLLYEEPSTYFGAYSKQYDIDYVFIGSSELGSNQAQRSAVLCGSL